MTTPASTDKGKQALRVLNNVFEKMAKWPRPTGLQHYCPRPTDIIIATFPKAGTTLVQNMAYQIIVTTGGAPAFDPDGTNFSDLGEVSPWVDFGPEFGIMDSPTDPRTFKTHGPIQAFDVNKSKFIYVVRDPHAYPASWLNFVVDWLSDEPVTDPQVREHIFHEFVRINLLGIKPDNIGDVHVRSNMLGDDEVGEKITRADQLELGPWFQHVKDWTGTPRQNLLVLFYEDIVEDMAATAKRIAIFMGRTLSDAGLKTVLERCDRNTMAADEKFRDKIAAKCFGLSLEYGMKALVKDKPGYSEFRVDDESLKAVKGRS